MSNIDLAQLDNMRAEIRRLCEREDVQPFNDLLDALLPRSLTSGAPADTFAVNFIERRAEQYLQDHADTEPCTGAVVFQYGEAGREYHSTLVDLADDIRAALKEAETSAPAACTVPPAGWKCTRAAGHEGPCAAVHDAAAPSTEQARTLAKVISYLVANNHMR